MHGELSGRVYKEGIGLGIPIAYFIKTSIVNEGNFRDL